MFTEKLRTKDIFVSNVTVVSDAAMLLFGGPLTTVPTNNRILAMHAGFYQFEMTPETQRFLLDMRDSMNSLLDAKLASPHLDVAAAGDALVRAVLEVLHAK